MEYNIDLSNHTCQGFWHKENYGGFFCGRFIEEKNLNGVGIWSLEANDSERQFLLEKIGTFPNLPYYLDI